MYLQHKSKYFRQGRYNTILAELGVVKWQM
nr:MAG TPA: hypothetical protein [Caudoviricetes sp.]